LRVRQNSMKVNAEFSEFEDDPESKKVGEIWIANLNPGKGTEQGEGGES
jgi:hypothetical protein